MSSNSNNGWPTRGTVPTPRSSALRFGTSVWIGLDVCNKLRCGLGIGGSEGPSGTVAFSPDGITPRDTFILLREFVGFYRHQLNPATSRSVELARLREILASLE